MKECPHCGGPLDPVSEVREVEVGSRSGRVLDEFFCCRDCSEALYLPGQMDATLRRASDAIREAEGLLSPEEIRAVRTQFGLTQSAFEKLLGVGPKTVVRWEKGAVFQNGATDSLLRLVREFPEVVRFLAERHGVTLPDLISLEAE
jgi:HTH-type transcriptional regulator/antitoxin MqsA